MRKLLASVAVGALLAAGLTLVAPAPASAATASAQVTAAVPVELACSYADPEVPGPGVPPLSHEVSVTATAPATVAPGARFTVSLSAETDLPADLSGFTLSSYSDLALSFPVPDGSSLVSASLSGGSNLGPGTPTVDPRDGAVWIGVPGPVAGGTTVTFPTLELTLDADPTPGATVETRVGGSSFEAPGFTVTATVDGLGTVWPRCYPVSPVPVLSSTTIVGTVPSIDLSSPVDGGVYPLGEVVAASYSCSGAETCIGDVPDGSPIDTSTPGPHDFTVEAVDTAGVRVSRTVTYQVTGPDVAVSGCRVAEGATCRFEVTVASPAPVAVSLDFATVDGSARADENYTTTSGTLILAPGETSETIAVPTINDGVYDPADRTFDLEVSSTEAPSLGTATATGTVTNTTPPPLVVAQVATVVEGDAGSATASVPVVLANIYGSAQRSAVPVTVDWRTGDYNAHAPGDYAAASGTLTFAPGEMVKYIPVSVVGDTLAEPREIGLVGLSNPVNGELAGIGPGLGFFDIRDDDPRPAASVSDVSARALGAQPRIMRFTVTLNRPFESYASVDVATVDGTAVAGIDYLPVSKTVLFTPMATSRAVWVWVLPGSSGKDFTLELSNPVDIHIGDAVATGTIT